MALNQTNKLVWIVETIYRAHKISFEELNRRWMDNVDLSGGEEMLKRTFHKWKWNIFDTFGLSIDCEKTAPYRYYIANVEDMKSGSIENWLLSTLSVSNFLLESKSVKNRIILEDVPSGREYLELIIDAMKKNRFIHINYFNYWKGDTRDHYVMPLCVKLYRQRWYLVWRNWAAGYDLVFCLALYNKDKKYTLILSKAGDNILYADKAHDITNEVIAGLNKAYKQAPAEKAATEKKK